MISIIMPYKNAAPWLEETVRSIQDQSYNNWELIAVNDHSEDTSSELLERLALKDSRIIIRNNPGAGIISALQEGLLISKGIYITRMDADDLMPPDRLKKMTEKLIASKPRTIVTGKVRYFSEGTISEGYRKYESWINQRVELSDHYDHLYRECIIASPNWITRKNDLIEHKIFDQLEYPEDYSMVFLWHNTDFKIDSVNEVTLLWREHPSRTSRSSEIYDQESFFRLKLSWFKRNYRDTNNSIGILGAGKKGKLVVQQLDKDFKLCWYDLNYTNYNNPVLGHPIRNYREIDNDLLLIAIFPENLDPLNEFLLERGYVIGKNAWFL